MKLFVLTILSFFVFANIANSEIEVKILGDDGQEVRVSRVGQLVVGNFDFNISSHAELAEDDQAETFILPLAGKQFVITTISVYGDKQVLGNSNSLFQVYEATAAQSETITKELWGDEIGQNERSIIPGINLLVSEGAFVNAKCDDDDLHVNILGYFIPVP